VSYELDYIALVHGTLTKGERRETRAGPSVALFGAAISIGELMYGFFPLLTTRQLHPKPVLGELAAFVRGAEDLAVFKSFGCNYWDGNAQAWVRNAARRREHQRVGKIYGAKWRDFHGVDQLSCLVNGLREDPYSRRHLLVAWDPSEEDQCLPPCHVLAQFYVTTDKALDVAVYMRSVDLCLGLPSDVILYSALLCLLAKEAGCSPGAVTFFLGDAHVYENHVPSWHEQEKSLVRAPPRYKLSEGASLLEFLPGDFEFPNYQGLPRINYELNVG